jgi:hypothetical protein
MIDQLKDILNKEKKNNQEENSKNKNQKELVKFDLGILDNYPSIKLEFSIFPSNFGIKTFNGNKKDSSIKNNSMTIFSNKQKISSLYNQLKKHSEKSEYEKYKRIYYQSKLISRYKKKEVDKEFISSMIESMPEEYEIQINLSGENGFKIKDSILKIYVDDLEKAEKLENELETFRQDSLNKILENKVNELKNKFN